MNTKFFTVAVISCVFKSDMMAQAQQCGDGNSPDELQYFCGDAYELKTAQQKLVELWTQCQADQTVQPVPYSKLSNLFTQGGNKSFRDESDELPRNRPKINHAQGTLALVEWQKVADHPYTGFYGMDTAQALLRLSEGNFDLPEAPGLTPSMALKFTRNGMPSTNILANVSFEPTNSFDFFAAPFRTNIETFQDICAQETIEKKFLDSNAWINNLGLLDFARYTDQGADSQVADGLIRFPFDLYFEYAVTEDLWSDWQDRSQRWIVNGQEQPFYEQLKAVQSGTTLFKVMVRATPTAVPKHIANIVTKSEMITSAFGDSRLFFKHELKKPDIDFKNQQPEFDSFSCATPFTERTEFTDVNSKLDSWPTNDDDEAESWVRGMMFEHGCPFAWLLNYDFDPILS